jgi:hypothetical protein
MITGIMMMRRTPAGAGVQSPNLKFTVKPAETLRVTVPGPNLTSFTGMLTGTHVARNQ